MTGSSSTLWALPKREPPFLFSREKEETESGSAVTGGQSIIDPWVRRSMRRTVNKSLLSAEGKEKETNCRHEEEI
jgi:hypothetical protein